MSLACKFRIGILQHNVRVAPAELENGLLQQSAGLACDGSTGIRAAGQGRCADHRVLDHGVDAPAADQ
jgi:hypothetical protein